MKRFQWRTNPGFSRAKQFSDYRKVAGAISPQPSMQLIRGTVPRREGYRQQPWRRIQVSQRGLVLIVGFVANLAGVVARLAVALVLPMASGVRGRHIG